MYHYAGTVEHAAYLLVRHWLIFSTFLARKIRLIPGRLHLTAGARGGDLLFLHTPVNDESWASRLSRYLSCRCGFAVRQSPTLLCPVKLTPTCLSAHSRITFLVDLPWSNRRHQSIGPLESDLLAG